MLVLQAGSLATFSSMASLLAYPAPVSTGMDSAFRPLINGSHHPTLILCTKGPQQPREDDEWCSIVWSSIDQREQSRFCARRILASLSLVVFELCRRVRPLPTSSSISHVSLFLILTLPRQTN